MSCLERLESSGVGMFLCPSINMIEFSALAVVVVIEIIIFTRRLILKVGLSVAYSLIWSTDDKDLKILLNRGPAYLSSVLSIILNIESTEAFNSADQNAKSFYCVFNFLKRCCLSQWPLVNEHQKHYYFNSKPRRQCPSNSKRPY